MSNRYSDGIVDISQVASNDKYKYKLTLDQFAEVAGIIEAAGYEVERRLGIEYTIPYLTIRWKHKMP